MRNAGRFRPSWRHGALALGVAASVASAAIAVAPAGAAQPARLAGPGLLVQPVPPDGPRSASTIQGELQSVFCTSSANCWAVGFHAAASGALLNEVVHWNGKRWSQVPAPSPGGSQSGDSSTLSAVRCPTAANCWAVGSKASLAQVLHWGGAKWRAVPVPEPGGTGPSGFTELKDVTCVSADSCWAAGTYLHAVGGGEATLNLIVHWNGKKWFKVTTPNPAGTSADDVNVLHAVRCSSPADCWAGGWEGAATGATTSLINEMLHWNGKLWSARKVPSPGGSATGSFNAIYGLSCASAGTCWAVGEFSPARGPGTQLNLVLRWDGRRWSRITTPDPDGTTTGAVNILRSASCAAKNDCWAIGSVGNSSSGGSVTGQALHWNGAKWRLIAIPNPAGTTRKAINFPVSIRCNTASDCWIVGDSRVNGAPFLNLFLHWNGMKWSAR